LKGYFDFFALPKIIPEYCIKSAKITRDLAQQGIEGHAAATYLVVTVSGLSALMRKGARLFYMNWCNIQVITWEMPKQYNS
jgi:hypothetical protein